MVGWRRLRNAKGLDNSNLDTGTGDDTISINTNANSNGGWWWWNRGGNADSVGIDNNSSINTGAGNDSVTSIPSHQALTPMPGLS